MSTQIFPENKIQQFVVQFACRIPARRDLTPDERNALDNLLREFDPNHFQLPVDEPSKNSGCLFQTICQLEIGASVITSPSFVFSRDSFSFFYPVRLTNNYVYGFRTLDTKQKNEELSGLANRVMNAVNGRGQRAGKIYMMVLGPFDAFNRKQILQNLCAIENLNQVGEFNFTFTFYQKESDEEYNLLNHVSYVVQNLEDRFYINVRVDINNRRLRQAMEPPDIKKVWDFADRKIASHLQGLLTIGEGL